MYIKCILNIKESKTSNTEVKQLTTTTTKRRILEKTSYDRVTYKNENNEHENPSIKFFGNGFIYSISKRGI